MQKIQRFLSGWAITFRQQGFVGKVILVLFSLLFLCFLCGIPIVILSPATPTPEIKNTDVAKVISSPITVETAQPTDFPKITATNTPESPTPIPVPTEAPDPYIYLAGDWPNGVWDYIFNPERGAHGHLKVYMGEQKSYIFEIIGAADCSSMPSGQGYLVRYPNGDEEWKDRQAMENLELFVLKDELTDTFRDFNWMFYQCP